MSKIIEKVARALATKHYTDRFHPSRKELININVDGNWNIFVDDAKAAIEAMKEPTEEMIEAVVRSPTGDDCREDAAYNYKLMIEIASGEKDIDKLFPNWRDK